MSNKSNKPIESNKTIEHRAAPRTATTLDGQVTVNGAQIACRLKNISSVGAKVNCTEPLMTGADVTLSVGPFGTVKGLVAWSSQNDAGIKFTDSADKIEPILLGLASYGSA